VRRLEFTGGVKFAAADGRRENGVGAFGADVADEAAEVFGEGGFRVGAAFRVGDFFVVVAELDDHGVTGLEGRYDLFPAALGDEAEGAAAVHGVILHGIGVFEKPGE
jgi:hypothetical protein